MLVVYVSVKGPDVSHTPLTKKGEAPIPGSGILSCWPFAVAIESTVVVCDDSVASFDVGMILMGERVRGNEMRR